MTALKNKVFIDLYQSVEYYTADMSAEIIRMLVPSPELPPGTKVYILSLRGCFDESPLSVEKGHDRQEVYDYLTKRAQERKESFYKWLGESGNKDRLQVIKGEDEQDVLLFGIMFAYSAEDLTEVLKDAPDLDHVHEDIKFRVVEPFNT